VVTIASLIPNNVWIRAKYKLNLLKMIMLGDLLGRFSINASFFPAIIPSYIIEPRFNET